MYVRVSRRASNEAVGEVSIEHRIQVALNSLTAGYKPCAGIQLVPRNGAERFRWGWVRIRREGEMNLGRALPGIVFGYWGDMQDPLKPQLLTAAPKL